MKKSIRFIFFLAFFLLFSASYAQNIPHVAINNGYYTYCDSTGNIVISDDFTDARPFSEGLAAVQKKVHSPDSLDIPQPLYGFIDPNGNVVIDYQYLNATSFRNGQAIVETQPSHYGVINQQNKIQTEGHELIEYAFGNQFVVRNSGKWQAIDLAADRKSAFFDNIWYQGNAYIVAKNGRLAAMDTTFYLISDWYVRMYPASNGMVRAQKNGQWGYINCNTQGTIAFKYDDASDFQNNIAKVQQNYQSCLINRQGEQISEWYEYIYRYYSSAAIVAKRAELYAFLDTTGQPKSEWFDVITPFYYGTFRVKQYNQWALANSTGEIVTNWYSANRMLYHAIDIVTRNNKQEAALGNEDSLVFTEWYPNGMVQKFDDYRGTEINFDQYIPDTTTYAYYTETFSYLKQRKGTIIFDGFGHQLTPPYDVIFPYKDGNARVKNNGKFALLGSNAKVISEWYEYIYPFYNNVARVENDGKMALINRSGQIISRWYKKIYSFSDGLAKVWDGILWGFIDNTGQEVIPLQYEGATSFAYSLARVWKNNSYAFINQQNKQLTSWYRGNYSDFAKAAKEGRLQCIADSNVLKSWLSVVEKVSRSLVPQTDAYSSGMEYEPPDIIAWNYPERNLAERNAHFFYHLAIQEHSKPPQVALWAAENLFPKNYGLQKDVAANRDYTLYDQFGEQISPWYKAVSPPDYSNFGHAIVYNGKKMALMNQYGELVGDYYSFISPELWYGYKQVFENKIEPAGRTTSNMELQKFDYEKTAFINSEAEEVTDWYNEIYFFENFPYARVLSKKKYALLDTTAHIATTWYDEITYYNPDYLKLKNDQLFALADADLTIKTAWYDSIRTFSEQLAAVKHNGLWGYIAENAQEKIGAQYDSVSNFNSGRAMVKKSSKYALIDPAGHLLSLWFDAPFRFNNGFAKVLKDNKYALMLPSGQLFTEWFDAIDLPYAGSFAKVERQDKYSYINREGEIITHWFDYVFPFSENFAKVMNNKQCGFIDTTGQVIVRLQFDDASSFQNGYARVEQNGIYTYMSPYQNELNQWFDYAYPFGQSLAIAKLSGGYVLIDRQLKIRSTYCEAIAPLKLGLYLIKVDGQYAVIEHTGKRLSEWYLTNFISGLEMQMTTEGDVYFTDEDGNTVIEKFAPELERNTPSVVANPHGLFTETLEIVKDDSGKMAFRDINGNIVSEWYDNVEYFIEGKSRVTNNGSVFFITKDDLEW